MFFFFFKCISLEIYIYFGHAIRESVPPCAVLLSLSLVSPWVSELTQTRLHVSPSSLLILTTVDCFFLVCRPDSDCVKLCWLQSVTDLKVFFFCWCVKGGQNGLTQDFIRNNTNKFKFIQTLKAVDPHCSVIYCFQQRVRNLYVVSVGTADGLIVFLYFAREKNKNIHTCDIYK